MALIARAADQPTWGHAWTRNMVSSERGLPASFDPKTGRNVKWVARLGTESHATPVIASGRVLIGTNNGEPRDPKYAGDRGVLMCFDESDGRFLWQLVVPKRVEDIYYDWPNSGICSPPTIEGDRAYVVDNRGVVLCLDLNGMANGNDGPFRNEAVYFAPQATNDLAQGVPEAMGPDGTLRAGTLPPNRVEPGPHDADIIWMFDLSSGAGIWSHDAVHSASLIRGPHLYLNTGTGVDNTHRKIRRPDAPGLIVLDKATGRLLAREAEGISPNIFHATWAAPALASVHGRELILFAAGDGMVYAFEPLATNSVSLEAAASSALSAGSTVQPSNPSPPAARLKLAWKIDFDPTAPKTNVHRYHLNKREGPSNFYGAPVFQDGQLYVAGGGDLWWGKNEAWLKCYDVPREAGDAEPRLRWSYPLVRHTFSTPAVHDGLVFVTDCGQTLHCVDARTGDALWTHDASGEFWASPLVADGKVYAGTRRGQFLVCAATREKRVLATVELGSPISATAVAANGVLYVTTMANLYALQDRHE